MNRPQPVITRHGDHVTDATPGPAHMTGMTDYPASEQLLLMTHDRYSLVPPYACAGERNEGNTPEPSSVTATNDHQRRTLPLCPKPHNLTERAQLVRCRSCQQPVIAVDLGAQIPGIADPTHLSPLQELEHLVAGHRTYRLIPAERTHWGNRWLQTRWADHIRTSPGEGLPEHVCGQPPLTPLDLTLLDPTRPLSPDSWIETDPNYTHPEGIPF